MAEGTKKCKYGVSGMKVSRSGNVIKCEWSLPSAATKSGSKRKATGLRESVSVRDGKQKLAATSRVVGTGAKSVSVNINDFGNYTRRSFYPFTQRHITSVKFSVVPVNRAGKGTRTVSKTYTFEEPRKPKIGKTTIDPQTGTISCTITTDAGTDSHERYDTEAVRTVVNTRTGKTTNTNITHTSTSKTDRFDATDYQQLSYDQYIAYKVKARARGVRGASEWATSTPYYVSFPRQTTITGIGISSISSSGKATIKIKTNQTTTHPVDKVVLEVLADVTYAKASQIPAEAPWRATDSVDDGECTALAASVAELMPEAGHYTWVRVKSIRSVEGVLFRYSDPMRVRALEVPATTAADESIKIIDAISAADGEGAVVTLAWNADGTDDADGTELTWSESEDAWRSTDDPDSYEFEWSDGELVDTSVTPNVTYHDSATITIKGLDAGELYYVKARRYLDGDRRTYSPYSNARSVIPSAEPVGVTLMSTPFVPQGSDVECEWTFGGGGVQRTWRLRTAAGEIIDSSDSTAGRYVIPAARAASLAVDGVLSMYVEVSTGGVFVASDTITVGFMQPPTLTATAAATLTVQPLTFSVTASEPCSIVAKLESDGVSGQQATGIVDTADNAVVWSEVFSGVWTDQTDTYTQDFTLPVLTSLVDESSYRLTVSAVSDASGLQSAETVLPVAVNLAHKAPFPLGYATVTPQDYVDADGVHHMQAVIDLNATVGEDAAASTDVFDIYRLTADGAELIGSGYPLSGTFTDAYAPFGTETDLAYRIAIRTVDGAENFDDIEYDLYGNYMRIDWQGGYIELPYNIALSDAYAKDVEIRTHGGGVKAAYYNEGVTRTGRLSSVIVRADGPEGNERMRQLANYVGAAFVRLPDGSAYEADVQVSDLSTDGVLLNVSISTSRVDATEAYMLPAPPANTGGGE